MLCDETKEHTADILMPHEMRKGNHSSFLMPTEVGGRCPLPPEICAQSDPPPLENCRLRQVSAYNILTVKAREKFALKLSDKALILFVMPHRVSQKCNFVILRITLDVNRKRIKLRSVSLP